MPLVEAMAADVPVLAYAAGAVPETLGGAGVLFAPKDLEFAAEMLGHARLRSSRCASAVLAGQRQRLQDFAPARDRRAARRGAREDHRVKIAFIVQRYGTEILGGSEYHCRLIAERLAPRHHVEVLTTCARDYITWKNEYPEGHRPRSAASPSAASRTRRRATSHAFNRYSDWIFNNPHTRSDEMEWLRQQGPWCPALLEYLERNHQQYDVLIFFTYLYAPTVLGVQRRAGQEHPRADRARRAGDPPRDLQGAVQRAGGHRLQHRSRAAVPDDPLLDPRDRGGDGRLRRRPAAGPPAIRASRAGGRGRRRTRQTTGRRRRRARRTRARRRFRPHLAQRGAVFRRRHRLHGPFLLYGGRIDPGKGCEELIEYFSTYVQEGGDASLVLMGVKLMPLPEEPFIRFAGRLSDQERLQALEAATVVVVPSPYESLSLLALESFAVGTPILANARSEVLVDHCRKSNAGLYYADRDEFGECLRLLIADDRLRAALGRNGRAYVRQNYRWDVILGKYEKMFARLRPRGRRRGARQCERRLADPSTQSSLVASIDPDFFAFVADVVGVGAPDSGRVAGRRRACGAGGCRAA